MLGAIFFSFLGSFYLLEQTVFAFFFSLGCARAGDEAETARCEKYAEPILRTCCIYFLFYGFRVKSG